MVYQRQACSMNVLGDLLEVTATCSATWSRRPVKSEKRVQLGRLPKWSVGEN
jgi:hypothetical protein